MGKCEQPPSRNNCQTSQLGTRVFFPIGLYVTFYRGWGLFGLWFGLVPGMVLMVALLLRYLCRIDFNAASARAHAAATRPGSTAADAGRALACDSATAMDGAGAATGMLLLSGAGEVGGTARPLPLPPAVAMVPMG